jgi:hypothetical protein
MWPSTKIHDKVISPDRRTKSDVPLLSLGSHLIVTPTLAWCQQTVKNDVLAGSFASDFRLGGLVDLTTQPAHMKVYQIGVRDKVVVPH